MHIFEASWREKYNGAKIIVPALLLHELFVIKATDAVYLPRRSRAKLRVAVHKLNGPSSAKISEISNRKFWGY